MSLHKLLLAKIERHHALGILDEVHRLQNSLYYLDARQMHSIISCQRRQWSSEIRHAVSERLRQAISCLISFCGGIDMPINKHPTIEVYNPFLQQAIPIDTKIAPLLEAIWKLGIKTENSCQDCENRREIWICFSSMDDLKKFFNHLLKYGSPKLCNKSLHKWAWGEGLDKRDNMHLAAVWFPISDLELIMTALTSSDA